MLLFRLITKYFSTQFRFIFFIHYSKQEEAQFFKVIISQVVSQELSIKILKFTFFVKQSQILFEQFLNIQVIQFDCKQYFKTILKLKMVMVPFIYQLIFH